MLEIFYAFAVLAFVASIGMFIALLRENGYRFVETCKDVVEAIQDIKAYKAKRGTKGT